MSPKWSFKACKHKLLSPLKKAAKLRALKVSGHHRVCKTFKARLRFSGETAVVLAKATQEEPLPTMLHHCYHYLVAGHRRKKPSPNRCKKTFSVETVAKEKPDYLVRLLYTVWKKKPVTVARNPPPKLLCLNNPNSALGEIIGIIGRWAGGLPSFKVDL